MNDLALPISVAVLAVIIGVLMAGEKMGRQAVYDNCINYHSDQSVIEARATCEKIVVKGKK